MMKQCAIWAGYVVALYVLQTSLLPLIGFHGITVNLMLLLTVSFAFLRGVRQGVLVGFLTGLMEDLASGTFLGMNTLSQMVISLACGRLSNGVFKEQFFLPVFSSLVAAVVNYFILATLMLLLGYRFNLLAQMQSMLPTMLIYQLAFAYPVHRLTYDLDRKLSAKQ